MRSFSFTKVQVLVLALGENGLGVLRAVNAYSHLDLYAVNFDSRDPGRLTWLVPILRWPDSAEDPEGFESRLKDWSRAYGISYITCLFGEELIPRA